MKEHKAGYLKLQIITLFVIMAATLPIAASGQAYMEKFGQNRIQTRKFAWKFFDTKHFRVYHYDKAGRDLGRYVAEEAENDIAVVEKKLSGQFPQRFSIILYNSYEDYRQTNVGLKAEQASTSNARAGTVNLVGDKLVVYFTGQHNDLQRQIRAGMSKVVMERMIFGDDFKKIVKNAFFLNLPPWVTEGYLAYLVDGWDPGASSQWKSLLNARPGAGFYQLSEEYPELAGKAFWKFIATQYGQGAVKNLLYSMQNKTSLNKAMKEPSIMNMKVTRAYDSCIRFYKNTYALDAERREMPDSTKGLIALSVPKDGTVIRNIRVSPRASDVAYVAWKDGKYTVYTQKTSGGQLLSPLLEGGQKDLTEQTDPNYPMLAWSTNGNKLAILYKKGDKTLLRIYNSFKGRIENYVIPPNRFDRALGMCFMQDDDKLIFSAVKKSQTDLYMMTLKGTKVTNITDDVWDEVAPTFVSGGSRTGILFLSNRPKPNLNVPLGVNELPVGPMNIFFYNTNTQKPELLQCTNISKGIVSQPIQYGFDNFAYLYDSNGVNNKYVVLFARDKSNKDSSYSVPITNYATSMLGHQYNMASGDVADVIQVKTKYMVYFHDLQMPGVNAQVKTLEPTSLSIERPESKAEQAAAIVNDVRVLPKPGDNNIEEEEDAAPAPVKSGNAFQSEFADDTVAIRPKKKKGRNNGSNNNAGVAGQPNAVADSSMLTDITDSAYVKMKPSPYRLNFKPDFFSVKLNNNVLFSQYQSIAANGGQYTNPPLGALTTISLDEMMEDHRITAGFQLPIDFGGSTYFIQYQNFRRRLDWGVTFLRYTDKTYLDVDSRGRPIFTTPVSQLFKTILNSVQLDLSYPLDRLRSIRFNTALRQDRMVEKATDTLSLAYPLPNTEAYTSMSRLEYVFDNTISPAINILNGTRFKFYGELFYGLDKGNKTCYNLGLDIRNYQKIYKNVIVANRLAYAHSDGNNKVQYMAGGVDNWLYAQRAPGGESLVGYGFQTISTPLRGYKQGARTGNNFAVFNTEVRAPILTTFMKRPIQSSILKNLQVIAFVDAGMAWKGFLPDANSTSATYQFSTYGTNNQNFVNLQLTVPNGGGLALGYGAGLRTSLLGYFVRLDAAWNIEGKPKPIVYFSLGTDF